MRWASVGVVSHLEDVSPLPRLSQDETELAPRLLAGPLAVGLPQLTALGPDERLAILIHHLVPCLPAKRTPDGDPHALTGLLRGAQGGALVPVLLSPEVDVVKKTLERLLGAKIRTELHAQGWIGHIRRVALLVVLFLVIILHLAVRVDAIVNSQLQALLGEGDLVLENLFALDISVVELLLAVHHELGELQQLLHTLLEALETTAIDDNLPVSIRGATGAMMMRCAGGGGLLLLKAGGLLHGIGGSSHLLLVKVGEGWIHAGPVRGRIVRRRLQFYVEDQRLGKWLDDDSRCICPCWQGQRPKVEG